MRLVQNVFLTVGVNNTPGDSAKCAAYESIILILVHPVRLTNILQLTILLVLWCQCTDMLESPILPALVNNGINNSAGVNSTCGPHRHVKITTGNSDKVLLTDLIKSTILLVLGKLLYKKNGFSQDIIQGGGPPNPKVWWYFFVSLLFI